MIIKLFSKKLRRSAGYIVSGDFTNRCDIHLFYRNKPEVIRDIQEVLLRHYNLVRQGEGGRISKYLNPRVKMHKVTVTRLSKNRSLRRENRLKRRQNELY